MNENCDFGESSRLLISMFFPETLPFFDRKGWKDWKQPNWTKKRPADGKLRGAGVSKKWRCRRHCCHSLVAGTTAVVPARFVSHLRVANRLRRLCPPGTRFPAVPVGVLGAEPLSLMPQHSSREPAKRCSRARAVDQGFFDSLTPRRLKTAGREAYSFSRRALPSRTSLFSSSMKLETSVNCRYTDAKRT